MKRRALLTSAGSSLAALSGCLLFTDSGGDRQTSTRTATPNATGSTPLPDTPTPEVTVESAVQQYGYARTNDDAINVGSTDTHYLAFDVTVEAGFYEHTDFTLVTGSAGVQPIRPRSFYRTTWGDEQWYEQGSERGLLVFELPDDLRSSPPRLEWPAGEWLPDTALAQRLTTPKPLFDASLAVPDPSDGATEKTVEVTVTNEGDVEGRYLGAVNRVGPAIAYAPVEHVSGLVGTGETATIEIADSWSQYPQDENRGDGETDVTYHLEDADGGDTLDIAVDE